MSRVSIHMLLLDVITFTYSTPCDLVTTQKNIIQREQLCVPERFDNVRGDGGPALVRVGLPGEGDGVFGHLRHYRLLWRSWELEELRNSGH